MRGTGPSVIVIGAGILGASAAYFLQRGGARVLVVDAGGDTATAASFGWINASFHHDEAHFRLRAAGIEAWRRLSRDLSLPLRWDGALCWEEEAGPALEAQHAHLTALGYDVARIDRAAFERLEPQIATPPAQSLHFTREGATDSAATAGLLLAAAVDAGARRMRGLRIEGFAQTGGRITGVRTQAGLSTADQVLIAAGTGSAALMAQAGAALPMLRRPGLMLRTRPVPPVLSHILVSRHGELRQLPDGTLLMPAAIDHQADTSEHLRDPLEQTAAQVLARLRRMLPQIPLDWQEVSLALRPVPRDGLPVIGAVQAGLHVACMHSGVTLGALAGEMVAQEMLEGVTNRTGALLAPYRPQRFSS